MSAPALRALLGHADDRVRLHALWTLDGLGAVDPATLLMALDDGSAHMRTAALRIAEPYITRGDTVIRAAVTALVSDSALPVRRQLAASLVAFPETERFVMASALIDAGVTDAVSAELVARATGARAVAALARMTARVATDAGNDSAVVEALAAQIARAPRGSAVERVLAWVADGSRSASQRIALMTGLTRGATEARAPLEIATRPGALLAMARARDTVLATAARRLAQQTHWAGKPAPAVTLRALTVAETARIAVGREEFGKTCAVCHQLDGAGLAGVAKSLVGSTYVNGAPSQLIRIVLQGKGGTMLMPPVGATMTDERIASILSFVRREWGNRADPIDAAAVKEIRGATTGRKRAWTVEELARVR